MSLFEFDEKYYMDLFREEYRQEGIQEGISQGIRSAFTMLKDVGLTEEDAVMKIAAQYHLSENEVRRILSEVPDKH